ncbi:MAG: PA2169 family four-helix-bundle protein [Acidobacteriaceae bacterium]|nr:PA2169 family four-helix-bundle protein [Acidobacteriaceae bacterium]MBV9226891.1 PA2169 family four-helix-bundle protein [Acidobacteriaceae bacterium]
MTDASSDSVSAVNHVVAICKDAEEGFRGAANAVKNASLRTIFEQYSSQRAQFAQQLRAVMKEAGSEPANPSGVAGTLHRGWIILKGVLTGHSDHQILIETERGEDLSLSRYRDALAANPSSELKTVLERQYAEVQQAHSRIRELRDRTAGD